MTGIVPDRFDAGSYLKLFLIRHRSQLRENFLRVIRCIEGFLRRFARAQAFAILPLGIGNLQACGVAQDQTSHVQRRWCSVDGAGVAHSREQRQPAGMIQMSVRENDRVEFAIRSRWRAIQRLRFFATLKQTAIDKNSRLLCLNDVTRTGYFAASCANEGDFHRDDELVILCGLKQARLLDFRLI